MPKITNDLIEIWGDIKELIVQNSFWLGTKHAPPSVRSVDLAFIPLLNKDKKVVGCFVPELYELAKTNDLRCQADSSLRDSKTPFEHAVLPVIYSDQDKKSYLPIQIKMEEEFNYRIERGLPLPPVVNKYHIKSDYLRNISQIALTAGSARGIKLNLINPPEKTGKTERALHYLALWAALLLTVDQICKSNSGSTSSIGFPIMIATTLLTKWCSNEFSTYGTAEHLLREIGATTDKSRIAVDSTISLKKTLKSLLLLSTTTAVAVGAGYATRSGLLSLPFPALLTGLKYGLAGVAASVTTVGSWFSIMSAQRFYWGIGFRNKQIDFSKEKTIASPHSNIQLKQELEMLQDKFQDALSGDPEAKGFFIALTEHLKTSKRPDMTTITSENTLRARR